jgi:hypothetical protein
MSRPGRMPFAWASSAKASWPKRRSPRPSLPQDGTEFVAARYLNPNRIAVVQVGTRLGPNGIETFINVERLQPSEDQN